MSSKLFLQPAGVQLMFRLGMVSELYHDWRNDVDGLGTLLSNHLCAYRNKIT